MKSPSHYAHHYYDDKENMSSLCQQVKVQYSILSNQRWFRALMPLLFATCWLVWGVRQQRQVVRLKKVQLQFPTVSLENTTHWCYLNREGTGHMYRSSIHMPFAVEWVAGCWAWLESRNQTKTTGQQVAIGLDRDMYQNFLINTAFPEWNRQFFHALQIPVVLLEQSPSERPVFYTKSGPDAWFGNTHSCSTLRERLWKALNIQPPASTTENESVLHIGIVERPSRRLIIDSDQLAQELQQHFPNTTVSYRVLTEDVTLADQASWFAQQDIMVMAHGAGATNLIFMRPDAQLLELFPTHFFTEMYQNLAQQCDIHHDWYYDGGPNPQQDMLDHMDERHWRRNQNIHITLEQLKSRVEQMMVNLKQY